MRTLLRLHAGLLIFIFVLSVAVFAQNPHPGKTRDDCAIASKSPALTAGCKALDDFMTEFNSRDSLKWAQTLNYPHVRIAGNEVIVWSTAEDYAKANDLQQFAKTGWHHSQWDWRRLVQKSDDKLHFLVQFTRYNDAGKPTASYESLYILTKRNNHWGVQARSSFAGIAIAGSAF
jgi:hypothetical protein